MTADMAARRKAATWKTALHLNEAHRLALNAATEKIRRATKTTISASELIRLILDVGLARLKGQGDFAELKAVVEGKASAEERAESIERWLRAQLRCPGEE